MYLNPRIAMPYRALAQRCPPAAQPLIPGQEEEALEFLEQRPVHTVYMRGQIRDNGVVSRLNRGRFFAYRNSDSKLEGIALIGHAMLMETTSERALAAFAQEAHNCSFAHMMLGEEEKIELFWKYFATPGQQPRRLCTELLFELRNTPVSIKGVPDLRQATLDDLALIVPVNASMVFKESGVNPVKVDFDGFCERLARRIEKGRVWLWAEGGQLIFKLDVLSQTPETTYVEGVFVAADKRGFGYGKRCMAQMAANLLPATRSICLLSNESDTGSHHFYWKSGFVQSARYETIFLKSSSY